MSNIIDGIDFGMGYEIATKWEPGLHAYHPVTRNIWVGAGAVGQQQMDYGISKGWLYRRRCPILANHPEAIPLEPGEVLQVGDRGLTRNSYDTGPLRQSTNDKAEKGYTLFSYVLQEEFNQNGKYVNGASCVQDIIARLPNVAREAEKAKEEKEMLSLKEWRIDNSAIVASAVYIPEKEAARLYLENESVRAEVQRQEEAKRIGPGDWVFDKDRQCVFEVKKVGRHQVVGIEMAFSDDACEEAHELSECRKLNLSTDLIAALNAEIDAKAGG